MVGWMDKYAEGGKLPENIKDRKGIGVPNQIRKNLIGEQDGFKIVEVDDNEVKTLIYPDFTEGGNGYAYPDFVPKDEIWVSMDKSPKNKQAIILHELDEVKRMQKGKSYEQAHEVANQNEMAFRNATPSMQNGGFLGTTNRGRNYSPAWKGPFQNGGWLNKYEQAQNGNIMPSFEERQKLAEEKAHQIMEERYPTSGKLSGIKYTPESYKAEKERQKQAQEEWDNLPTHEKVKSFAIDAALAIAPELIIGKGLPLIGRTLKNSKLLKVSPKFTSEINWGVWNKEIPENKALMKEYLEIEKLSKSNGTWMKNSDGSLFKGTPEQFVQQNSNNFKKAFPNPILNKKGNIQTNYHGTPQPLENSYFRKNTDRGEIGTGIYTTTDKGYANAFANSYVGNQTKKDISPTVYELYQNSNNPQLFYKEYYEDILKKDIKKFNIETLLIPKFTKTYKTKSDMFNKKFSDIHSKLFKEGKLHLMPEYDSFTKGHQTVVPFNNYPKSAIGNNGMFDMTNPNIYKGMVPLGIGYGLSQNLEKIGMQNGGEMSYYQNGLDFKPKTISQNGIKIERIEGSAEQSPVSKYDSLITEAAKKHGIPPALYHRLIYEESKHNPNAKSGKGARGLSQITRATADLYKLDKSKLNDPAYNIDAGAKILKAGFDNRKVKDWKDAVGYYNSGNKWFNKKERPKVIAESPEYFKNIFYEIDMLKAIDPTYVQTIEPSIADKTFVAQQKKDGGIVKDNLGYWNPDNWGKAVEIGSPNITMQGVDRELIGVSDEGDTKLLKPGKDYKFKGKKVTEYPIAKYGIHELEQLTNFANNNKPSKNWLNKYST